MTMPYRSPRERIVLCIVYGFYFLAGSILALDSPESLETIGSWNIIVWHGFLAVGSLISIYGVARRLSIVEAVGLPLLLSVLVVYIIALLDRHSGPQAGLAALLGANFVLLVERAVKILGRLRLINEMTRR